MSRGQVGFTKMDVTEIPRIKKSAFASSGKS